MIAAFTCGAGRNLQRQQRLGRVEHAGRGAGSVQGEWGVGRAGRVGRGACRAREAWSACGARNAWGAWGMWGACLHGGGAERHAGDNTNVLLEL